MIVIIQYTITDYRKFFDQDTHCLPFPDWPNPQENEFAKFIGNIQYRKYGGLNNWIGESNICLAKRGIKIVKWLTFVKNRNYLIKLLFRRFFFDGEASGKFEIGFRVTTNYVNDISISQIVDELLNLELRVPVGGGKEQKITLGKAEDSLAKLYTISSSKFIDITQLNLVFASPPTIIISKNNSERFIKKSNELTTVINSLKLHISHSILSWKNKKFDQWILTDNNISKPKQIEISETKVNRKKIREIRIILCRLISERKSLNIILKGIDKGLINPVPFSQKSDQIQYYLIRTIRNTIAKENFLGDNKLIKKVRILEEQVKPGSISSLYQKLQLTINIRPQIWYKVEEYLRTSGQPRQIKNNIIMRKNEFNISGGKNININQAKKSIDQIQFQEVLIQPKSIKKIKNKIELLFDKLNTLKLLIDSNSFDELSQKKRFLEKEIIKDKPKKKILKSFLDDFLSTAKKIGSTAIPLIKLTQEILKML
ncbi:hypothetical protein ACH3O9_00925 [Leeuwenhoekiella sp. A16]|uniref:hypothetical protein n=1 Tax=Leeuwenhoekiella sp. A16 TaxID=3141462 RepID=UPI003A7FDFE0